MLNLKFIRLTFRVLHRRCDLTRMHRCCYWLRSAVESRGIVCGYHGRGGCARFAWAKSWSADRLHQQMARLDIPTTRLVLIPAGQCRHLPTNDRTVKWTLDSGFKWQLVTPRDMSWNSVRSFNQMIWYVAITIGWVFQEVITVLGQHYSNNEKRHWCVYCSFPEFLWGKFPAQYTSLSETDPYRSVRLPWQSARKWC
jgi:hypothetical protein